VSIFRKSLARPSGRVSRLAALALCAMMAAVPVAGAQTLRDAFSSTYSNNPDLNAARSTLRAVDENIAIAKSGNRPQLFAAATASASIFQSIKTPVGIDPLTGRLLRDNTHGGSNPVGVTLTLTQPLFQGFSVRNAIRGAESAVRAQRQILRSTEQDVLFRAATSFFDVIQNRQIVQLLQANVRFLDEQVRAAQDRFDVGEGTRTDVSQAEAARALAISDVATAQSNLAASEATFRQVTGLTPGRLVDNITVGKLLPPSLESSITIGQNEHPAILAALHNVDTAVFNVKSLEGDLLPDLSLQGQLESEFMPPSGAGRTDSAAVALRLNIPIYQGGRVSAQVRQAKEDLGTARISVDLNRDGVRQTAVAAWAAYRASLESIQASRTSVFAAQLAVEGVIEEQRVGQRTTLDVLEQQSDLITAQITLAVAERNAQVAAYALLSAVGRLTYDRLNLTVVAYQPKEHYKAVNDKWFGLRTPDGR
jgi:outer membrane protein